MGRDDDVLLAAIEQTRSAQDEAVQRAVDRSTAITHERLSEQRAALLAGFRADLERQDSMALEHLADVTGERDGLKLGLAQRQAELNASRVTGLVPAIDPGTESAPGRWSRSPPRAAGIPRW